jgi:hypothetical protein
MMRRRRVNGEWSIESVRKTTEELSCQWVMMMMMMKGGGGGVFRLDDMKREAELARHVARSPYAVKSVADGLDRVKVHERTSEFALLNEQAPIKGNRACARWMFFRPEVNECPNVEQVSKMATELATERK